MFHSMNFVRPFVNYAIFRELCDRMRFEVDCAKSHHRVISEGLSLLMWLIVASRCIVGVCILSYCKSLVTNEVDSGIQMCRRSVQLLTFNIIVLL